MPIIHVHYADYPKSYADYPQSKCKIDHMHIIHVPYVQTIHRSYADNVLCFKN